MRSYYYDGYSKTKKGRVVYRRKKHYCTWADVSRVITNMDDSTSVTDVPLDKSERYYGRMRAATYLHIYAMFRQYPAVMRQILLEMVLPQNNGQTDNFAETWKAITLKIASFGLTFITKFIPNDKVQTAVNDTIMYIGEQYYDWLFSLTNKE